MAKQYVETRKTTFWITSILSVLLLAIHVVASTHVTHYDTTDLGLLTKLPVTFWIGLSCLGVLLYLCRKSERRTVIVVALISFYLFGIPVLIRENKAEELTWSYYRVTQSMDLLSEGHLGFSTLYPLDSRNWPGFFYSVAFVSSCTGISAFVLADYFPLLTIALLGVITYSILRLQFSTLHSSLGALWFIGSFWTGQHYFGPQSIAYIIYFAIFLLLAKLFFIKKQRFDFPLCIIVLFTAVVASHLLTSFMIVAGVVATYALCKISPLKGKTPPFYSILTCILLASIFFSYQSLVTSRSFSTIIEILSGEISRGESHLSAISQPGRIIGSTSYLLEIIGTYSITIINVGVAIFAILITFLGLLFRKKGTKHEVFWIAWIIIAGIFGISLKYGAFEAIERAFMFMLLPTTYFSISFLNKKPKILILVLIILIFIHIPAHYSREMYTMIPTSEMRGITFFVKNAPPDATYLYQGFYLPFSSFKEIRGTQIAILGLPPFYSLPSQELINETVGRAEFVISSNLCKNCYLYFVGLDPLENLNFDDHYNRIYDNELFRIHGV